MWWSALLTLSTAAFSEAAVQKVASQRVLFAHQSVGANVLEGLSDLTQSALPVREGRAAADLAQPGLVHTRIGTNELPLTKLADFEAVLAATEGRVDVALLKLCYVDIDARTDVDALFEAYVAMHERLRARYPRVTFVPVTVPLTVVASGPKAWLKAQLTGAPRWGAEENAARHRFNTRLRARFVGQPLFDLAALEATRPDGSGERFAGVPALAPAWTDDGQHLNARGRRHVAEALLTLLAGLP